MEFKVGNQWIGDGHPVYFIADIAANHDGDLDRALELIHLAKEAGADAAKFQNFEAKKIVSDYGFKSLGGQQSHQSSWTKSVFEVYDDASVPFDWTPILKAECDKVGIAYFSSPYDFENIDKLYDYMPAYKAGSGLMSYPQAMMAMAEKDKPFMLSTGACDIGNVAQVMRMVSKVNPHIVLMQCNTNYTASDENYDHLNINVLKTYATMFPDVILGLSDHTHSNAPVVGAVALGAKVIERHFTDSNDREGPDHKFAMNPTTWRAMVDEVRILERTLGSADKFVTPNEKETMVLQRRCLRAARAIKAGETFTMDMVEALRPAVPGAVAPFELDDVVGKVSKVDMAFGQELRWHEIE